LEIQDCGSKMAAISQPWRVPMSIVVIRSCCGPQRKHLWCTIEPRRFVAIALNNKRPSDWTTSTTFQFPFTGFRLRPVHQYHLHSTLLYWSATGRNEGNENVAVFRNSKVVLGLQSCTRSLIWRSLFSELRRCPLGIGTKTTPRPQWIIECAWLWCLTAALDLLCPGLIVPSVVLSYWFLYIPLQISPIP